MSRGLYSAVIAATLAALAVHVEAQQPAATIDEAAVRTAVERALETAPRGFDPLLAPQQTGVRVNTVEVSRAASGAEQVTIDLSQRTLTYDPSGNVEALLDRLVQSTAALTADAGRVEYRFLIDGLPLDRFLTRAPPRVIAPRALGAPTRIVVSAGHGVYWNQWASAWTLQRNYYWGIAEDLVNWQIADYLREELLSTPFEPHMARQPDHQAPRGTSGYAGWQEGSTYFVRGTGAPPEIWDIGVDDYARDINTRPFFANWIGAAAIVSIHNNGGGGTGTETWYDETNGEEAESARLAGIVNRHVVSAIRATYDPQWPDRGLRSCNGCKGENRLASRPAILVEIAFMDMQRPDNDALHDDRFKRIVARAIRDGLHEWAGLPFLDD